MSNANFPPDDPAAAGAPNPDQADWDALGQDAQQAGGDAAGYGDPDPFGQAEAERLAEREQFIADLAAKADGSVGISMVVTSQDQQRELNDALRQAAAGRTGGTEYAQGVGSVQIGDVDKMQQDAVRYLSFNGKERTGHEVLDFSERTRAPNEQHTEERVRVTYAVDGAVFDTDGNRLKADDPRGWAGTSNRSGNHFGIGFDLSPDDAARLRQATENDPTLMRDLTDRIAINRGVPEDMWRGSEDKAGLRPPYERMFGDEPRLEVQGEAAKHAPQPEPAQAVGSPEPQRQPITDTEARRDPPTVPKEPAVGKEQGTGSTPEKDALNELTNKIVTSSRSERSFQSRGSEIEPDTRDSISRAAEQGDYDRAGFSVSGGRYNLIVSEGQRPANAQHVDRNYFPYGDNKPGSSEEYVSVEYDKENGEYYFKYRQSDPDDLRQYSETGFRLDAQTGGELYRQLQQAGQDPALIRHMVDAVNREMTPGSDIADRDDIAPLTADPGNRTANIPDPNTVDPDDAPTAQTGGGGGQPPVPPKPPKNPNGTPGDPNKPNDPNDPNNANDPTKQNQAPNAGKRMPGDLPPGFKDMSAEKAEAHVRQAYKQLLGFAADIGIQGRDQKFSLSAVPRPRKEQREKLDANGNPRPDGELMVERLKEGIDAFLRVRTFHEMGAYKDVKLYGDKDKSGIPVDKLLELIKSSEAVTPDNWLMREGDGKTYEDKGFVRGPSGEKIPIREQDVATRVEEHDANRNRAALDENGNPWYYDPAATGKYAGAIIRANERIFIDSNGNKLRGDQCTDKNEEYTPAFEYKEYVVKNNDVLDDKGVIKYEFTEVEGKSPIDGSQVTFNVRMPIKRELGPGELEHNLGRNPNEDQLLEDIIFFQKKMWQVERHSAEYGQAFNAIMRMPLDLRSPVITRNYDLIRQLQATDMMSSDPATLRYAKQIQDNIIGSMQKRLTLGRTLAEDMSKDPAYWDALSRRVDGIDQVDQPDGNTDWRGHERGGKKDKDGDKSGSGHENQTGSLDKLLEQFNKAELTAEDFDKLDELLGDIRDKMVVRAQDYNRSLLARTEQPDDDEKQRRAGEDTAYADQHGNDLLGLRRVFVIRHNAGLQAHGTFHAEDEWKALIEEIEHRGSYIGDHEEGK